MGLHMLVEITFTIYSKALPIKPLVFNLLEYRYISLCRSIYMYMYMFIVLWHVSYHNNVSSAKSILF